MDESDSPSLPARQSCNSNFINQSFRLIHTFNFFGIDLFNQRRRWNIVLLLKWNSQEKHAKLSQEVQPSISKNVTTLPSCTHTKLCHCTISIFCQQYFKCNMYLPLPALALLM